MAIARAGSAKFKEFFISGQLKVIPLFRYSVFRVLPVPLQQASWTKENHNWFIVPEQRGRACWGAKDNQIHTW